MPTPKYKVFHLNTGLTIQAGTEHIKTGTYMMTISIGHIINPTVPGLGRRATNIVLKKSAVITWWYQ